MSVRHPRLRRERLTIQAMITCYCRGVHGQGRPLCAECRDLLDYAAGRLDRCPFQESKPTCAQCTVHCYRQAYREKVKAVMRYAGPRMIWRHPLLALGHLLDGHRRAPERANAKP